MQTALLFPHGTPTCSAGEFLFDEVYGNISNKAKFASNSKYDYFNILTRLQHKIGTHSPLYNKIFKLSEPPKALNRTMHNPQPTDFYHIEPINKLKFKIYKTKPLFHRGSEQRVLQYVSPSLKHTVKPQKSHLRILEEYRKKNLNIKAYNRQISRLEDRKTVSQMAKRKQSLSLSRWGDNDS